MTRTAPGPSGRFSQRQTSGAAEPGQPEDHVVRFDSDPDPTNRGRDLTQTRIVDGHCQAHTRRP